MGDQRGPFARRAGLLGLGELERRRLPRARDGDLDDESRTRSASGAGPALGAIGNVFGIWVALAAGAAVLVPALGLYGRAIRHHGREPELEQAAPAPVSV